MSTELETITDEVLLSFLKHEQESTVVLTHREWSTTDEASIAQCIERTEDLLRLDAEASDVSEYEIRDNGIHQLPPDGLITSFGGTIWIKAL